MARNRTILAAAGSVATVVGVAAVLAPSLAGALGLPEIPVSVVGGLAGLFAGIVALRRRGSRVRGTEPSEVEVAAEHPVPGTDFDAQLQGATGIGVDAARNRRLGREHLADVAVAVLTSTAGYSESEAEAALVAGTWTDDPFAAACFADEPARLGIRRTLVQYVDRRSQYQRELVHAIDALQTRIGEGTDR